MVWSGVVVDSTANGKERLLEYSSTLSDDDDDATDDDDDDGAAAARDIF